MPPQRIVILRHAEKPGDPAQDLPEESPNLSIRGFARAAALAYLLPEKTGSIDFIVAAAESKHSNRPIETVTPLAQRLSLPVNSKHVDDDFQSLADALLNNDKYTGKTVVICWHHGRIPDLATALGVVDAPRPWPSEVFDRLWTISHFQATATLAVEPQEALFNDSPS